MEFRRRSYLERRKKPKVSRILHDGPSVAVSQSRLKIEYDFTGVGIPTGSASASKPKFNNRNSSPVDMWNSNMTVTDTTTAPDNSMQYQTDWVDEAEEEPYNTSNAEQPQLNAIGLPLCDVDSYENNEDAFEEVPGLTVTLSSENLFPKVTFDSPTEEHDRGPDPHIESLLDAEEKPHKQYTIADGPATKQSDICNFHIALMVFVTSCDISEKQYTGLREVLQLATLDAIASLPQTLRTLKSHVGRNLPLQTIRSYPIPVQLSKLRPKAWSPCPAYRFELFEYCQLWLANPTIRKAMHFGMGVITTDRSRTEFYHGDAWLGSVRTTSGEFAFISDSPTDQSSQEPLFPSDCVVFHDPASPGLEVFGRVSGIAIDQRINTPVAIIQRILPVDEVPSEWRSHWRHLVQQAYNTAATKGVPLPASPRMEDVNIKLPELVLMEEDRLFVPVQQLIRKVYVHFLDYEIPPAALLPYEPTYCIRFIAFKHHQIACVRRIDQRHRLPAERELIHFGRNYVIKNFVQPKGIAADSRPSGVKPVIRRISLPFTTFIDAFGLYRNAYCSIDGIYINPASLNHNSRHKLQNWFLLMYGPFSSHTNDMIETLADEMPSLEKGILTTMPNTAEEIILTAFPLCILGDMPQQNANAGIRSHKSKRGCRYCFVSDSDRGSMDIPFPAIGRYSSITDHLRNENRTEVALNRFGLLPDGFAFGKKVFQNLDPHTGFPNDAMHCELRLAKYLHSALIEEVFTTAGCDAYSDAWQYINVPYGWGQPQNPITHKGSMVFSENGRLALLNPFVLLRMFEVHGGVDEYYLPRMRAAKGNVPYYIKPNAEMALRKAFEFYDYDASELRKFDPPFYLIKTAFLVAKAIYETYQVTLTDEMYHNLPKLLVEERIHLQKVFLSTDKSKKRAEVPNIHLANHYQQDIQLYGTPSNVMAAMGEQMHRNPKHLVTHTNNKERLLQLEKTVNYSQTMRHMADGAFPDHPFTAQFSRVIDSCTFLKESFLESSCQSKDPSMTDKSKTPDDNVTIHTTTSIPTHGRLDTLHTEFDRLNVGLPVRQATAQAYVADIPLILKVYTQQYGTTIYQGMSYKIQYWDSLVGMVEKGCSKNCLRLKTGGFVRRAIEPDGSSIVGGLRTGSRMAGIFYQVDRIATILIGSQRRGLLICWPMVKVPEELVYLAPYEVYRRDTRAEQPVVLGLHAISSENLHFVPKSTETWWWNCYVVKFN